MKLLIVEPLEEKVLIEFKIETQGKDWEIIYMPDLNETEMADYLAEKKCDGIIIGSQKFSRTAIESWALATPSQKKAIVRVGSNTSTIDIEAASERGIPVMNIAGGNSIAVAHNVMTAMLLLANQNQLQKSMVDIKKDTILPRQQYKRMALWKKKIALIGLGFVGEKVAEMANALTMEVVAYTPNLTEERAKKVGAKKADSLFGALEKASVLSIQTPYIFSKDKRISTHELIGEHEITLLEKGAIIINVGRVNMLNMTAIESALYSGQLSGFALDTYPSDVLDLFKTHPRIFSHPNVLITPCIYTAYHEILKELSYQSIFRIYQYFTTNKVTDVVNPNFSIQVRAEKTIIRIPKIASPSSAFFSSTRLKSRNDKRAIGSALTRADMVAAAKKLPAYIQNPDIEISEYLSKKFRCSISLVRADQSSVKSYKNRGAFCKIQSIVETILASHEHGTFEMIAASEGNHAQGVAKAVQYFSKIVAAQNKKIKILGKVYMPETTPKVKIDRTIGFGEGAVTVELVKGLFEKADQAAKEYVSKSPRFAFYVPPFDDLEIIKGQGTLWTSLHQDYDEILMGTGGGGLIASASIYFESSPVKLRGVQPAWAPSMLAALCADHPIELEHEDIEKRISYPLTVDGATISRAGDFTHAILANKDVLLNTASKNQIAFTFFDFVIHHALNADGSINYEMVPELAGILPLVILYQIHQANPDYLFGKKILCVITGSNISHKKIDDLMLYVKNLKMRDFPIEETPFYSKKHLIESASSLEKWISPKIYSQIQHEITAEKEEILETKMRARL